jgi:cell division protein ZapE
MTLIEAYEAAVRSADIRDDPTQRYVLEKMQRVLDELSASTGAWYKPWTQKKVKGLYLYGPVGVGKTYLGDLFYQCVPDKRKARFHFHQFMQQIDAQLRLLQGHKDPLRYIAAKLAKTTRLLCFDEWMVYDVADAMILAELLQALFEHQVVLVATSNTPPDDLYLNGPQRARFLPAIELIKEQCEVLEIADHTDYRLGRASSQKAYFYPLNTATTDTLNEEFSRVSKVVHEGIILDIQHRQITCIKCSERAVWFAFDVICHMPRSQLDYLEIADRFDILFVSDIPVLHENDTVPVILLIHLIDVMYDRGVRLVISAAVPLNQLYVEGNMLTTFKRTLSRLEEMQSEDYIRRHQRRQIQSI